MADTLAIPFLFDAVVARFALEGTLVPNLFGWRESAKKLETGDRIVWIPGDDAGALGEVGPARNPGGNARSLATLFELVTVEIVAFDKVAHTSELAQYKAARFLFDAWYRAVYLAAPGIITVNSSEWITDKKEARNGAGIRVVCSIEALIPDTQQELMVVDSETNALLASSNLNVTEEVEALAG